MGTKAKRTFGIGVLVIGAVLIVFSMIIKSKVTEGEGQISQAEESVGKGQSLFSLTPYTKQAGEQITSGANRKIAAGKEEVAYYAKVANFLLFIGIAGVVIGGGSLIFVGKSSR